ncbi:baseplate J/gp47 family protein [Thermosyntropha sp.]|uniref:baseplate J/gp47 family protein n=1 Tax=Thermosyntropha sp. TaxID=2740820 RepID=UPI0025D11AE9|nr:baseplate J/gp47 family protein [Thermosyntropha sp.]MBO8158820.1 baseplate J/gp47 family protein [Thermosyntropha sp.]
MFEDQTYEAIMARLLANVPDTLDKREGSFIWDALSPAALELAQLYMQLDLVLQWGFAQTTYGQYLDYRAAEHGLTRKEATKASGQVTITGTPGTTVPAGSLFATGAGVQFKTIADVIIGETGTVTANIEAVEAGASGNVPAGTITEIPVAIAGVTAVNSPNPTSGGTDQESDADLLARLLEKVRTPATSGNAAHYKQWALEVTGVGDAKIFPLWNGNGTVKVVIIDSNKQPASTDIVTAVASYIETVRPIGASVTVESATGLNIDVSATVVLDTGYTLADVQVSFENSLTEYLKSIAFQQDYVSYAKIGSLLLDTPGVLDYSGLTLNGGTGNVSIGDTEVAILGTVTLNE